ncbi:larval cuticle protein 1 [Drosophila obscura]|uniref:larval cuticle protein 1 n=1 Tax=Drosophila obscura TaxID=7282 RepID=UPI000BA0FDD4|nr:larval cuticle protein 1 [Drosophila obscura]
MFKFVMIFAVLGVAAAGVAPLPHAPVSHAVGRSEDVHAEVKSEHSDVRADGFDADLLVSNSIQQASSGDVHGNIHGSFSWISPEGEHVEIKYVADENGYQPVGAVLPTPPPIPEAIARAVAWLESHPQAPEPVRNPHH